MDAKEIFALFQPLWADVKPEDQLTHKPLKLAHYTDMATAEKIVTSNEIWFSNPLYMNDLEEVRFGVSNGLKALHHSSEIEAAFSDPGLVRSFHLALDVLQQTFETEHLLDTYVFCTSEHTNSDGLLSMWRGYGSNGDGAALVIDSTKLVASADPLPLMASRVYYGTGAERIAWFKTTADRAAKIIAANKFMPSDIHNVAHMIFDRIKVFALFTKHKGFEEEREWRVVYLRDRDLLKRYDSTFSYHNGPRGVEPKLKFPIRPVLGLTAADLSLERIVCEIILGPTTSSTLAMQAFKRMLAENKHSELSKRVTASTIPLRRS